MDTEGEEESKEGDDKVAGGRKDEDEVRFEERGAAKVTRRLLE